DRLLLYGRRARDKKEQAEGLCAAGNTRRARAALRAVIRQLMGLRQALGTPAARKVASKDVRERLRDATDSLRRDVKALRQDLTCPMPGVTTTTSQPPTPTTSPTQTTTTTVPTTTTISVTTTTSTTTSTAS